MNIKEQKNTALISACKCLVISIALALAACGGDSSSTTDNEIVDRDDVVTANSSISRFAFKPADGVIPVPSDLLFSGTTDGTLEMPDEVAGDAEGGADYADPGVALGALDGWSTQMPLSFSFDMAAGTTIDASSLLGNFRVFETYKSAGGLCAGNVTDIPSGSPCAPTGTELQYGTDFIASAGENTVALVYLKPLSAATTYVVAVLDGINDSDGNAIQASETYQLLKDTEEDLSGNSSLAGIQALISLYEGMIQAASGGAVNSDNVIYSMAMTTESVANDMSAVKLLLASSPPAIAVTDTNMTVRTVLTAALGSDPGAVFDLADYYVGSISLPYYLSPSTTSNPSAALTEPWKALCDNGILLSSGITGTPGVNDAMCQNFGLRDFGLDQKRHITQYNPFPQAQAIDTIEVQFTAPAAATGCGAGPFKVAILQHGITSTKEAMLLMTAGLSAPPVCMATIAIDHPLHGSRGFDTNGDSVDDISASELTATHYMNLAALLVARDNLKQSMADMLGLRLGLENFTASDGTTIDDDNVFASGLSLGGMTTVGFASAANASEDDSFNVKNISIHSAGGAAAAFLTESAFFGPIVQSSVISAAGTDLSAELIAFIANPDPSCSGLTEGSEAFVSCQYTAFLASLAANGETDKLAEIDSTLAAFVFAAQTVLDSADPNNYAESLAATGTPVHLTEIVGDGGDNLPDQVIPNQTVSLPIGGTEPLAALLGLSGVDTTTVGSALVRFTKGKHGSLLDPTASAEAPDALANAAVTTEIQTQTAMFFYTASTSTDTVVITDDSYIAPGD
jgi:Pla-1/cef family extracellular lipase